MNNFDLVITEKAYNDLETIFNFIAKDNQKAALRTLNLLKSCCYTLTKFPEMGIKRPDFTYKDVQFYIVKKRFIIAYKVDKNELVILRILSSFQDICSLF